MTAGSSPNAAAPKRIVGRYALYDEIAAGGMATVHFGRLLGPVGFSRTVAIKRLHPQFAKDPEFVSMFLDEARVAARIRHPNVVPTLDVVATQGELFLVMDYVQGESLSKLIRGVREQNTRLPPRVVTTIMTGALSGLHAAHEARNERGEPHEIVHRDVSPQNILVGQDGVPRVLDFGVAKAAGRIQTTREGQLKGKLAYMAPEQLHGASSRQIDVFAAAIVLWEALTTKRLFAGDNEGIILGKLLNAQIEPPSTYAPEARPFDEVVMRGLERDPARRWATAKEFASALERCVGLASPTEVGEWVDHIARTALHERSQKIAEIESSSASLSMVPNAQQIAAGSFGQTIQSSPQLPVVIEPASQMSSISVSKPSDPPKSRGAAVIAVVTAVLGIALLVVLALTLKSAFMGRAASKVAASAPAATTPAIVAASAPLVTASAPVSATAPVAVASAPIIEVDTPVPVANNIPRTPATSTARPHPSATASATTTPSATAPKTNCDPPYTLDDSGHKKWKPDCLN